MNLVHKSICNYLNKNNLYVHQNYLTLILLISLLIGLTSCQTIIMTFLGIEKPQSVDEKTILNYSNKYDIPSADSYELDTSFISYIKTIDTNQYKEAQKNHYQPLQALYFNKSGYLQSFHINCNAGGFTNLSWNRDSILDFFPPKQQTPIDSLIKLNLQLKYLRKLSFSSNLKIEDYDYIIVIYWSRFMGRQSKNLIHNIQHNCKLASNNKIKILYGNNDNIFSLLYNKS